MEKPEKVPGVHEPVMVSEVLEALKTEKYAHINNSCFVDATVGLGGHSKEFIKRNINVIGIDADTGSLKIAEEVLKKACPIPHDISGAGCFKLLHGNFSEIDTLVNGVNSLPIVGILFDLGISSFQLDDTERGFSFRQPEYPLDMRLDKDNQNVTASDLLAVLDKRKLVELFAEIMPDNLAVRIANAVIKRRMQKQILTTGNFLEVIKPLIRKRRKIDNATLPFLALRMAVNSEKENLKNGLDRAFGILAPGGRIVVISFHSGEDKIVKDFFRQKSIHRKGFLVTKKPVFPGKDEIMKNPRARSARMRIIEKI